MTDSSINASIAWADPARAADFSDWLAHVAGPHRLQPGSVRLASADASFRRYFRIDGLDEAGQPVTLIIMDAPPAQEDCKPFAAVARLMAEAGVNAPAVLAWDEPRGFMLLDDLGSKTMLEVIKPPMGVLDLAMPTQADYALFLQAIDALVTWQAASKPGVLPPYDEALLRRELNLFPDWYVEKYRGIPVDAELRGKFDGFFAQIIDSNLNALGGARVYVHRDFMPRNLMVASSGPVAEGRAAPLGVLDFQDAVYGPITYDIASLMRDAFISWDEDFVLDITIRYWEKARKAGLPVGDDFGEFYRAVEWMALQRHLKILGIFARLTLRDGKGKYLADTPRFIRYVRNTAARYRQLGPLMVLLDSIEGNETRIGYTF
ncbi:MAG: aminoglycoside phosphotransferase [Comamonadaceae bacterium]|nr:MAG: aminoglycoside phosphotransferase [Comamonadaceae bacterium]